MKSSQGVDKIQKSPASSLQSKAVALAPGKAAPSKPAKAGAKDPLWRLAWPKLAPATLDAPDPGLEVMAACDLIAADLKLHLPSDPYLKRLLVRHESLIREGEGKQAADEIAAIDHYIAEQVLNYARSRKTVQKRRGLSIQKSAAFAAVEYAPDRKAAVAAINFSITARGHESRGAVRILIT